MKLIDFLDSNDMNRLRGQMGAQYCEWKQETSIPLPADFDERLFQLRRLENWVCSECDYDLSDHPRYLFAYREEHGKLNSKLGCLTGLCIKCQAKKPGFEYLVNLHDYTQYAWMKAKGTINKA